MSVSIGDNVITLSHYSDSCSNPYPILISVFNELHKNFKDKKMVKETEAYKSTRREPDNSTHSHNISPHALLSLGKLLPWECEG